jgi:hypothetical protein
MDGPFVPGECYGDTVLNAGESVLANVWLAWVPVLRLSAGCGALSGSYFVGGDNYWHVDEARRYVVGTEERFGAPANGHELRAMLDGDWAYRSGGEYDAAFRFFYEGALYVSDTEDTSVLRFSNDRLYADESLAPDLLCFDGCGEETAQRLPAFFRDADHYGDYLVLLARCGGEHLAYLIQANNGDGALSYLVPGAQDTYSFLLHRFEAAPGETPKHAPGTFPAFVWKYDADAGLVWFTEAFEADETEDGSPLFLPDFALPCTAARPGANAVAALKQCSDPDYPLTLFTATVNADGTVELAD